MELKRISNDELVKITGGDWQPWAPCMIGVGLMFTPYFIVGAAIAMTTCLSGDSSGG